MKQINYLVAGILMTSLAEASVMNMNPATVLSARVNPNGDSADLSLENKSQFPVYCESLNVEVKMVDGEFEQAMGSLNFNYSSIYLQAGEKTTEKEIAKSEVAELRKQSRGAKVSNVVPGAFSCQKATFQNYCESGSRGSDENATLDVIKSLFGTRLCSDIQADTVASLVLRNLSLKSLVPLQFFERLVTLDLKNNYVSDLSPLQGLQNLQKVNLIGNPVASVASLLTLPSMNKVCIGDTPLYDSLTTISYPLTRSCR